MAPPSRIVLRKGLRISQRSKLQKPKRKLEFQTF